MSALLLCSNNPLLVKSLYGVLRDDGHSVTLTEHATSAVRMSFKDRFGAIIIDSNSIGLSAAEAAQIIRGNQPDMPVIILGNASYFSDGLMVEMPVDLEKFKDYIRIIINIKSCQGGSI